MPTVSTHALPTTAVSKNQRTFVASLVGPDDSRVSRKDSRSTTPTHTPNGHLGRELQRETDAP